MSAVSGELLAYPLIAEYLADDTTFYLGLHEVLSERCGGASR